LAKRIEFELPVPVLETSRRQVSVMVSEQLDERPRRPVLKPAKQRLIKVLPNQTTLSLLKTGKQRKV
jgi:hypothetical protein